MAYTFGWLALGLTGAWAGFYCLRRAKGSNWIHWLGFSIALFAGFGMMGTLFAGAVHWAANGFVLGGAGVITLALGLPAALDILKDKKPDTIAIIAALVLPSIITMGFAQIGQFAGDAFENMKSTNGTAKR